MKEKKLVSGAIAASLLSADFAVLGEEIRDVEKAGADMLHFDITDGHFVDNFTMGALAVRAAKKVTDLPLDVHLMIEAPDRFVKFFADAGADSISVHYEAAKHLNRTVQMIRDTGRQAGVAFGPATPLSSLRWLLEYIDYVLLLGVNPGFGGQALVSCIFERIRFVKSMIVDSGHDVLIQVDGGVNLKTISHFAEAGADIYAIGSALFDSPDYARTISEMRAHI